MEIFVFFFFQAEDGIRDLTVTGVQTCALPISGDAPCSYPRHVSTGSGGYRGKVGSVSARPHRKKVEPRRLLTVRDRKSTRLNSSHSQISYAVFCLTKKKSLA